MITVLRLGRKYRTVIGEYEGEANNMKDIARAMELARKGCPTGKLIIENVALPERKKKEPELK